MDSLVLELNMLGKPPSWERMYMKTPDRCAGSSPALLSDSLGGGGGFFGCLPVCSPEKLDRQLAPMVQQLLSGVRGGKSWPGRCPES